MPNSIVEVHIYKILLVFTCMVQLKDDIYLEAATSKNIIWDTFRAAGLNSLNVKILNTILLNWMRLHTKKAHTDHTNHDVLEYHPCEDHYDNWSIKISYSKENATNDFCFRLTAFSCFIIGNSLPFLHEMDIVSNFH